MGIPTNLGWFSLFGTEFTGPTKMLYNGTFPVYRMPLWILLIISHFGVVSLIFLVDNRYFNQLLIWLPLIFIVLFLVFDLFSIIYLLPFITCWIISLFKMKMN
jgi:hypothetical protein